MKRWLVIVFCIGLVNNANALWCAFITNNWNQNVWVHSSGGGGPYLLYPGTGSQSGLWSDGQTVTFKWSQADGVTNYHSDTFTGSSGNNYVHTFSSPDAPPPQYTNYTGTVVITNSQSKTVEYGVYFYRTDTGSLFNTIDLTLGPWQKYNQTHVYTYPWRWNSQLKYVWDDNGNPVNGPGGTNSTPTVGTNNPTPTFPSPPGSGASAPTNPGGDPINDKYNYPTNSPVTDQTIANRQNTLALLDMLGKILDEERRIRNQMGTNNSSFNDSNIVYALTNYDAGPSSLTNGSPSGSSSNTIKGWMPSYTAGTTNPVFTLPFSEIPTGGTPMEDVDIDFSEEHMSSWCSTIRAILLVLLTFAAVASYIKILGRAVNV